MILMGHDNVIRVMQIDMNKKIQGRTIFVTY